MFEFVTRHKRIVQAFLALIMLPFAFFGVDTYLNESGGTNLAAKINGHGITLTQFQQALGRYQEQLRSQFGKRVDPKMLDQPEIRLSVLDRLIDEHLLATYIAKHYLTASDESIRNILQNAEGLQEQGQFSPAKYQSFLSKQNTTATQFENQIRTDNILESLQNALRQSVWVPEKQAKALSDLQMEIREIDLRLFQPQSFLNAIQISDADIKKYFDSHRDDYLIPEAVKAEYVELSVQNIIPKISVSLEEEKKYYDTHRNEFSKPEERRASHILIAASTTEQKAAARNLAESLLKQLQSNPQQFAEFARKYSNDPGSATKGGDLGFFGKGVMLPAFEKTTFVLKSGQLSDVVETQFGYHIIRLDEIKPQTVQPFETVQSSIQQTIKRGKALEQLAKLSEQLNNVVYEQSDSLKPASELIGDPVKTSDWLTRSTSDPLFNASAKESLFSDDVLKEKRNTAVIEVSPNRLIAARIAEYRAQSKQSIEQAKPVIEQALKQQTALQKATDLGKAELQRLQKNPKEFDNTSASAAYSVSQTLSVSRTNPQSLSAEKIKSIFQTDPLQMPVIIGGETKELGFWIARVRSVKPGKSSESEIAAAANRLRQQTLQDELLSFLTALRQKSEVKIYPSHIEKKE